MNTRSSTSLVVFKHPFVLPGSPEEFPAGQYELLVEEELLDGLSFPAFRETAAFLLIFGPSLGSGPKEMRSTTRADVQVALEHDAELAVRAAGVEVAPSADGNSGTGTGATTQLQEVRTAQERIEQWINTLMSPLPH